MTVTVTERDDQHKSRESLALGKRTWDVHQQGELVGIFHTESEALNYRNELEQGEQRRHAAG
ncbi:MULTISPECIES: hypothetical protein [Pseudomonas]|uniref:DUF2188 domain-containing protein n=1 Tax=Pseudomonas kuykendallii TaxID=1007099 RepID=A0A2W5D0F1_9PSED|nr:MULTISPECIES: hypothetical protein [Pseudomonas]PZP23214.1 MAG: hypothetical protein DI599_12590 [Pseudomonas kuykendallii]